MTIKRAGSEDTFNACDIMELVNEEGAGRQVIRQTEIYE